MKLKGFALAIGLALSAAAAPASASSFVFDFSGNTAVDGSTTYRDYTAKSGAETLNVRASAWSTDGKGVYNAYLGSYGQGLGVTSDFENGYGNTHVIDNQGEQEFVLLRFSTDVLLSSLTTTAFSLGGSTQSDVLIAWGDVAGAWNSVLPFDGKPVSNLTSKLDGSTTIAGGSGTLVRQVKAGEASNMWLVGASTLGNPNARIDGFKLGSVTVNSAVPEPATWAMMILGFGAVGFAMRRRTSGKGAALAAA